MPSSATVTINEGGCSRTIPVDVIMSRKLRVVLGRVGQPGPVPPSLESLSLVDSKRGQGDVGAAGGQGPPPPAQKPAVK